MLGIPCTVIPSQVPEVRIAGEKAIPYAERLAQSKALSVEGDLVLAADTIVVSGQSILEKPADEADAFHMLSRLRGHSHKVVTCRGALPSPAGPPQDRCYEGHLPPRV
jgi:septum formation protein